MDARPRLITIPVSHYCEKGRWALDAAGLAYREDRYPPAIHRLVVARYGAPTAPVLIDGGAVYRGSDRILAYAATQPGGAHLMPADPAERAEVERLLERFDRRLGVDSRRWIYSWVLDDVPTFLALLGSGLGDRGRRVLGMLHPAVRPLIRQAFRVGRTARAEAKQGVEAVFAEADAQRDGSTYLVGDRFTAADLTFAALGAPLVAPPTYGVTLPPTDETPDEMRAAIERWRSTASGAAILTIYERHRLAGAPSPTPTTPGGDPR
jgi:glutathione S-transferase